MRRPSSCGRIMGTPGKAVHAVALSMKACSTTLTSASSRTARYLRGCMVGGARWGGAWQGGRVGVAAGSGLGWGRE
eukprot:213539-Chlamydomonas_euryale.AAC.1